MFWLVLALCVLLAPSIVLAAILVRRRRWLLLAGLAALLAVSMAIVLAFAGAAGDNPNAADAELPFRYRLGISAVLFLFAANIPIVLGLLSALSAQRASATPARERQGRERG